MSTLGARSLSRLDAPCRVMVVDDSAVIRGYIRRLLQETDGIEVVASAGNGQAAIDSLRKNSVDVIVLDIEMPVLDGLSALPKLLEIDPT
ncbi:MAG: two-component system chemotaxis response regulator CheB, partial [Alphaproteobacteria bacterium]